MVELSLWISCLSKVATLKSKAHLTLVPARTYRTNYLIFGIDRVKDVRRGIGIGLMRTLRKEVQKTCQKFKLGKSSNDNVSKKMQ